MMHLLAPSSSSEESGTAGGGTSSSDGSSGASLRRPLRGARAKGHRAPRREDDSDAAVPCWRRRRRRSLCLGAFCLGLIALGALLANLALAYTALDVLLAMLRHRCHSGGDRRSTTSAPTSSASTSMTRTTITVRPPTFATHTSQTSSLSSTASPNMVTLFLIPSSSLPSITSVHPTSSTRSSSSSTTSIASTTRPRLRLMPPNATTTSRSSRYWPPMTTASSMMRSSAVAGRVRVTAANLWRPKMPEAKTTMSSVEGSGSKSPEATLPEAKLPSDATLPRGTRLRVLPIGDGASSTTTTTVKLSTTKPMLRQGRQSLTVVTALLDIGREQWTQYGRTLDQYHQFMRNLLQLRVPMVVMVDEKSVEFVHRERARIGWGQWTKVRQVSLQHLPLAVHQARIARNMEAELAAWRPEWDPAMRTHPEASHPEYVVVVNSKPYFLAQAAVENPFRSEFFVWLDAGYGHGDRSVFPATWQWTPSLRRDKISLIKLTPPRDPLSRYGLDKLYRQDVAVLSGGFVAGDRHAVMRLYQAHLRMFRTMLDRQMVDDDQTLLVLLANEHPDLFSISHGDWFDAFELF